MYCTNCGTENPDEQEYCSNCGTLLQKEVKVQALIGKQRPIQYEEKMVEAYPMRWYKFIIYVQLFLQMILNLYNAITCYTGTVHGAEKEWLYKYFSGIERVDFVFSIIYLFLIVPAFLTRMKLANYKKSGPVYYVVIIALNAIVPIIYRASLLITVGGTLSLGNMWAVYVQAIPLIIMSVCTAIYFNKRRELFCE